MTGSALQSLAPANAAIIYMRLCSTLLKEDVEFVGVWGRSEDKARELGEKYHVPWFTDLDQLRNDLEVDAAIVSVANPANGEIGRKTVELGLHALLETPIANSLRMPMRSSKEQKPTI